MSVKYIDSTLVGDEFRSEIVAAIEDGAERCHVCGNTHRMVNTPYPLVETSNGRYICPYDAAGLPARKEQFDA